LARPSSEVLREARSVRYPKDSAVFHQGGEAESFFVLVHGHLRVEKSTSQGQQIVVRYVSPGEISAWRGRWRCPSAL
jgi:CRP-like cAMP-binding protein